MAKRGGGIREGAREKREVEPRVVEAPGRGRESEREGEGGGGRERWRVTP